MLLDALIFIAGVFAWTIVEYVIHGVLGHAHRTFVTGLHEVHHRDPRAVFALGAWIPTAVVLIGALAWFGWAPGVIFYGGIVCGFTIYEYLHYRIHFARPSCAAEERLRARHLAHHTREPDAIFGVTTRLWDVMFGTEPEPARMRELAAAGARVPVLTGHSNLGRIYRSMRSRIAAS
ncbi:sterol desaturase family protein [Candidatus Binatus sp.]|uniref:sterol desaturase family protein n=1 Tax=Candidatus Binatus sp. TaxID=2811406 RepID=UPI003C79070B